MNIRKILIFCILALGLSGCAMFGDSTVPEEELTVQAPPVERENALPSVEKAVVKKDVLSEVSGTLKSLIENSAYQYAPSQFFTLLVTYIEMQDAGGEELAGQKKSFDELAALTQQELIKGKLAMIKKLDTEAEDIKTEISRQAQADDIFKNVYPSIYLVKKGDTLPSIAARHEIYNDSFMWPLIYKANRDQIKDPKVIYAGQDLKIPRDMPLEEIIEARREAGAPEPEKIPKDAYTPGRKK